MGNQAEGVSSIAMQQGGIGLLLSTLIISVPPMAAMFFQGTLGSFSPYSVFGGGAAGSGRPAANGQIGAMGSGYTPPSADTRGSHGNTDGGIFNSPNRTQSAPPINNDLMKTK